MSKLNSVGEALELYVAPFDKEPEAWTDVLERAGLAREAATGSSVRRRRRRLVLVFAGAALFALGVSPVGGAIARGFGDFSAWLTGSPGEPASESDQRAFDAENERTWARFPDGPELSRVITTEAGGGRFELFGFRSDDSLCLRLTVEGIPNDGAATGCAPLSDLRRAEAPALAIHLDAGFGHQDVPRSEDGYVPPRVSASFGIVADGVETVELATSEGPVEALVENNAFLALSVDPPLGLRTKHLTAIGEQGQRASVTLAEAPFGNYGPQATPGIAPGPRAVERRVEGGTIGWLVRGEPRGLSLAEAGIDTSFFLRMGTLRFARALTPDPARNWRVALAIVDVPPGRMPSWSPLRGEVLCDLGVGGNLGGGGCSPLADWLAHGPISYGTGGSGGEQYVFVSGVASDDVGRMKRCRPTSVPAASRAIASSGPPPAAWARVRGWATTPSTTWARTRSPPRKRSSIAVVPSATVPVTNESLPVLDTPSESCGFIPFGMQPPPPAPFSKLIRWQRVPAVEGPTRTIPFVPFTPTTRWTIRCLPATGRGPGSASGSWLMFSVAMMRPWRS